MYKKRAWLLLLMGVTLALTIDIEAYAVGYGSRFDYQGSDDSPPDARISLLFVTPIAGISTLMPLVAKYIFLVRQRRRMNFNVKAVSLNEVSDRLFIHPEWNQFSLLELLALFAFVALLLSSVQLAPTLFQCGWK
jgi:hypothetical protein